MALPRFMHTMSRVLPDRAFLHIKYYYRMHRRLNLKHPKTFNEKLQWMKLNDRKDVYTVMVDKYLARDYVQNIIGPGHLIPLIGVWDSADDIDFDALPDKFVLKCNHNSGEGMCICTDKSKLDIEQVRAGLRRGLKQDYYYEGREWPYKNVPRKIICEQYMEDSDGRGELTDYKIHCYGGEPRVVQVITDRFSPTGMVNDHYTLDWQKLDLVRGHFAASNKAVERPPELDEMLTYARMLCQNRPYLRTDFYIINHQIYFGELTFFPASGCNPFTPEKWDTIFGEWIKLPIDEQ